jgi:putative redox protein
MDATCSSPTSPRASAAATPVPPLTSLPATLASCTSTMIALYARRREWKLNGLRVDVAYDTEATPRRFDISVHVPEGLTDDQVKRLRHVAETCPVRRALEAGFAFDEQLAQDLPARAG